MEVAKTGVKKLYSQRAIWIATFFGGPLAAGYLVQQNFIALEEPSLGTRALILGILSTIVIFGAIFLIPERILEKIPNMVIPLIYIGIVYYLVEKYMGETLKKHKEEGNPFYSGWRATGIGLISLALIFLVIIALFFAFTPGEEVYEDYNEQVAIFGENEREALEFNNHLNTKTNAELILEIDTVVIPNWKENIALFENFTSNSELPTDILDNSLLLLQYSKLRLEESQLFKKAISEDTDAYNMELEQIESSIYRILDQLN